MYKIVATSTFGLETILKKELKRMGVEKLSTEDGSVEFEGDAELLAKSNIFLRTADKVYIKLAEFPANSFEELFEGVYEINWQEILPIDAKIIINAGTKKSKLLSLRTIQSISKKAVLKKLSTKYNVTHFSESGTAYDIHIKIKNNIARVLLNSSGAGLHKRGYRKKSVEAPLKETLAAGLVLLSGWKNRMPFYDIFCGSGTIVIEAALIGKNIAPNISRSFAAEKWNFIDNNIWDKMREYAKTLIKNDVELQINGYDNDLNALTIARTNAKSANLLKEIRFLKKDAFDFQPSEKNFYLISSPPYGKRLEIDETFYEKLGKKLLQFDEASIFIITAYEKLQETFKRKAIKKRKLYNGNLKTYFYKY